MNQIYIDKLNIENFRHKSDSLDLFIDSALSKKISHAYILSGPKYSANTIIADKIAKYILGEDYSTDSIRINIDYVNETLKTNSQKSIGVSAVRDIIIPFISRKSIYDNNRIVIIEQADFLTEQAQNAMLKIIEDSYQKNIFIFVSNDISKIITTVRSRCQKIYVNRWKDEEIRNFLLQFSDDEECIDRIVNSCDGLIEYAILLFENQDKADFFDSISLEISHINSHADSIVFSNKYSKIDFTAQEELLFLFSKFIDNCIKSTLYDADIDASNMWRNKISDKNISVFYNIQNYISNTRKMLSSQVSWQYCLDYLLVSALEELNK